MLHEFSPECGKSVTRDGETFNCPGTFEVHIPAYFNLDASTDTPRLEFSTLGGGEDGMGGVVIHCTEYGHPAPRGLYDNLAEIIHALESKLKEALA